MIDFYEVMRRIDRARAVPRVAVAMYFWGGVEVVSWFMGLTEPNNAQSAFISVYSGAGAAFLNFYFNSGAKWDEVNRKDDT